MSANEPEEMRVNLITTLSNDLDFLNAMCYDLLAMKHRLEADKDAACLDDPEFTHPLVITHNLVWDLMLTFRELLGRGD